MDHQKVERKNTKQQQWWRLITKIKQLTTSDIKEY
jgi:hypothetical protein